jgi:hypothetical protein
MVNSRTFVLLPIPTNSGRIETIVSPTVVMLTTITPVQRVANQVLCTTQMQATPTLWADQLPECTRPSRLHFWPHSTQSLPPAAKAPSATSAQCLLPSWRHGLATTNPSRTVWQNATGQWHKPPANNHGHAGVSSWPRNDDECWTVPSGRRNYANDADGPTANGGTHVDEPLCPQPAAQSNAGVFLMSRGG